MILIALEIIGHWITMGLFMWLLMISCLYFAMLCEKIVNFLGQTK